MIQITCPNNNIPERTYAIEAFLTDVLGCSRQDYSVHFKDDANHYELIFDGKRFTIEDHFFNRYPESLSYLKLESLPKKLLYFHAEGLELPIIYGEDKFFQNEDKTIIGLDIFASTFFMLSRWEEFLLGREEKGDCDETQLFCVKHGIHQRPIVNEYAEFIRKLLPTNIQTASRNYEVVLSHDVDGFLTPSWSKILKDCVRQTLHGAPKNNVRNLTWKEEIRYKNAFPNAFSQFELYMALCEKYDIPEWFYFKVCAKGENEATYRYDDSITKDIIKRIRKKSNSNIVLGFHPSQNIFGKNEQWKKEVTRIKILLQETPHIGRNHHLLYNHETLRLWEGLSENIVHISDCVFHKRLGFRSGVCFPYHVFDLFKRRTMNLMEHPCIIMDSEIRLHKYENEDSLWKDINTIIYAVKKYKGSLVLTWHIYVRSKRVIKRYLSLCEAIISRAII